MFLPSLGDLSGIHPGCLEDETSRLGQALALELGDFLGNFVLVLLHVFFADHPGAGHGLYVVDNREILAVIRSRIGCRVEQLPAQVRGAFLAGKIVLVLIVGDENGAVLLALQAHVEDADLDVVFAHPQSIAIVKADRRPVANGLVGVIDEHPVRALVAEKISAALVIDGGVMGGKEAFRIREHPVVVR
ncbi:MAG: hypothetical protein AMJ59_25315 [Gammaproteobacteria bacterium SG8_31]|nr:MAG: hypothetical protein AMJ59_25315 [Gammaproteobacteria bacterium SG8_31]